MAIIVAPIGLNQLAILSSMPPKSYGISIPAIMLSDRSKKLAWFGIITLLLLWQFGLCCLALEDKSTFGDFTQLYCAGSLASSPARFHIYDLQTQESWRQRVVPSMHYASNFHMDYVPFICPLMIPLAQFPIGTAYIVWCLISIVLGAWGLFTLLSVSGRPLFIRLLFLLLAITSFPGVFSLHIGQTSLVICAFTCFYFYGYAKGRDISAGIALALTSIKPQYTLIFCMPAVATKRWLLLGSMLASEAILAGLAALAIGWRNVLFYPAILNSSETYYAANMPERMVSLRTLFSSIFPASIALKVCFAVMLIGCGLVFLLWRRPAVDRSVEEIFDSELLRWQISLTVVTALLVSPHTYVQDTILLAIPAILTLLPVQTQKHPCKQFSWASAIWYALLCSYSLISPLIPAAHGYHGALGLSVLVLLSVSGVAKLSELEGRSASSRDGGQGAG